MGAIVSDYRIRSAEHRVDFFEAVLRQHRIANACGEFEEILRDFNLLLAELLFLDSQLQEEYFEGKDYDSELGERFAVLFAKWVVIAQKLVEDAKRFEAEGHLVSGAETIRLGMLEVKSGLNPSDTVGEKLIQLRDQSVDEYRDGKSLPTSTAL